MASLHRSLHQGGDARQGAEGYPGPGQGVLAARVRPDRHQVAGEADLVGQGPHLRDGSLGSRDRRAADQEAVRRTAHGSREGPLCGPSSSINGQRDGMSQSINQLRVDITKRFGTKTVLDQLKLEIGGREFVTFLGPSGCGKSTALGIIAGLIPPSEGEIWNDDQPIDSIPSEKRGFGMVFQNYALFPHLTVFDNVALGLSLQHRPATEVRERVLTMLGQVRLLGYEDRYPGQLSGGQQQRVAIARALVLHPRLMLLD